MQTFIEWTEQTYPQDEGLKDIAYGAGRLAKKGFTTTAHAVTHPIHSTTSTLKTLFNSIKKPYDLLQGQYGSPVALAILAGSLGLHAAFPALAVLPASLLLAATPGIAVADAVQLLQGKKTLIAQGVQQIKQMSAQQLAKLKPFTKTFQAATQTP